MTVGKNTFLLKGCFNLKIGQCGNVKMVATFKGNPNFN